MLSRYKERQDGTNRWLINSASSAQYGVRLSLSLQHCMHQLHAMILPHSDHLQPNTHFMNQSYGRSILVMMPIANPVSLTDDADLAYPAVSA
jgi:hypothetical protein